MSSKIEVLAEQIVALDPSEQAELLDRVAELNLRRDLEALSQKYRERLAAEGKLSQKTEEIMAQLEHIREVIAANDHRP
jgi:ribosomal silencing factor RsfS